MLYVKCPSCQAAVEPNEAHCPKCNAEIPTGAEVSYWKCPTCGMAVNERDEFCPKCNTRREQSRPSSVAKVAAPAASSSAPSSGEWAPISMWGYFGFEILYAIPVIGIIWLLVNAIGAKNRNVKNFARSYFCFLIVAVIVGTIVLGKMGINLWSFGHSRGYSGW